MSNLILRIQLHDTSNMNIEDLYLKNLDCNISMARMWSRFDSTVTEYVVSVHVTDR